MNSPQDIGNKFEADFAKKIGGTIQPGSGNQWFAKLDVKGNNFLWSLKATKHASFRLTTNMLNEAINAAANNGSDTTPGMGVRVAGEDFVVLRADDFVSLVKSEAKFISPTKREQKLKNSSIPKLLREEE